MNSALEKFLREFSKNTLFRLDNNGVFNYNNVVTQSGLGKYRI